jgi:C-terminal processing protease CtpA/Prc
MISDGSKNWLSIENVEKWKTMLAAQRKYFDKYTIDYLEKRIEYGTKNPNSWYNDEEPNLKYDKTLEYPKKVAVLSNENNGSSGETFLMVAREISDKVIVFGQNSAGYLDYGNLNDYEMPCDKFGLSIPMRRANYLDKGVSYDKNGYPPDVYIPKENKNWIEFVKKYWKTTK